MRLTPIVGLTVLALSNNSFAQRLTIDELPKKYCSDENSRAVWTGGGDSDLKCVLEFVPESQIDETEAVISLNGSVTKIFRTQFSSTPGKRSKKQPSLGERWSYVFYSKDKRTKVLLKSHVVSSSCYVNTESCCGDDYEGTLTVERDGSRSVIPINYYRGG